MAKLGKCGDCLFWRACHAKSADGRCHMNPPTIDVPYSRWPETRTDYGCGQWRSKDEPEATPGLSRLGLKSGDTLVVTYPADVLIGDAQRDEIHRELYHYVPDGCKVVILTAGPTLSVISEDNDGKGE